MTKRKICVVTGSRAEYGLLYWPMKEIQNDPTLELQVVATGTHLSPEFDLTYKIIEADGFKINEKLEMLLSSDTPVGIAKSIGLGVIGFADVFDRLVPDLLVLLGDRYEMLAAAQAALVARIPIAHICGGDVTEGAFDESIRHCITKMAHLHFVSNEESGERVKQLGENPNHVYNVGSPGIDFINKLKLLTREELEKSLDFKFKKNNLLITFHPVTLEFQSAATQFNELLTAIDKLGKDVGIIFTKPNSDTDGRVIGKLMEEYTSTHPNAKSFTSLGQIRYLSAMSQVDVVVGNSSSGLYEAPSFKKPTVNIGDRQKGRLKADSVIDCLPNASDIENSIRKALALDCKNSVNPYGQGDSAIKIKNYLKQVISPNDLLKKTFFKYEKN
jgi:UDP-hydrolysing UDP-N-acetyl-D-glucosamine 2-epimerase